MELKEEHAALVEKYNTLFDENEALKAAIKEMNRHIENLESYNRTH